jgi:Tol biopolymer transport system component
MIRSTKAEVTMLNVAVLSLVLAANLAYVHQGNVWIKGFPDGLPRQLSEGGGATDPEWSPSGQWLKFLKNGTIVVVSQTGIRKELTGQQSAWSPQRDELAFIDQDGLCVLSFDTGEEPKRVVLRASAEARISGFAWSPDSIMFAVSIVRPDPAGRPEFRSGHLWRVGADELQPQEIFTPKGRDGITPMGWSSDGQYILAQIGPFSASVAADGLALVSIPLSGGPPRNLAAAVLVHPGFVSLTRQSREILAVSGGGRETWTGKRLMLIDPATAKVTELTGENSASWSPEGNRIAYVASPDNKESQHLAVVPVIETDGRVSRRSAPPGGDEPRTTVQQRRIWIIDEGGNRRQLTFDPRYRDEYPVWSSEGQSILFVRIDKQNKTSVWSVAVANGALDKILDDIDGIKPENDWFGYYGYIDWSKYLALSPE